ncbi:helix-turn-helix transcriptional regulator [Chromobacterium alticapitis]|uniref:DNA-binding protein n=1 Tax=Chromobacterium alticapitis TaxID=2073169 RepID=A0A2S5DBN6_9NEIS|nr:helix-turn-helix domain-containing protein [Chromobacterium alticapitis]POZ60367.1 DNA-binding protein [Chromobacterium alticapitis]
MDQLLSPKMLADYLGLAEQTIYNRHSSGGDLPKTIKLGRLLRFRLTDVDAWLEKQSRADAAPVQIPAEPSVPRRRGRPTKAEQIAARRAC